MHSLRDEDGDSQFSSLSDIEIQWQQVSEFLELKGYALRARYRKNWQPSWELPHNKGKHPECFEDHISLPPEWHTGIDAVQIATGRRVWIKRMTLRNSDEFLLGRTNRLSTEPRNHCVPMLERFHDEDPEGFRYIVTPFLRPAHDPPLETIGDAIDFVTQILDGLAFLHEQSFVTQHGEYRHILMNGDPFFPDGFHPVKLNLDPTARRPARQLSRRKASAKYYFTSFESVHAHEPLLPTDPRAIHVERAFAPELYGSNINYQLQSMFEVDIWNIGQVLKTKLLDVRSPDFSLLNMSLLEYGQVYSNVDFVKCTLEMMLDEQPGFRLRADQCRNTWQATMPRKLSTLGLSRRLRFRTETRLQTMALDMIAMLRTAAGFVEMFLEWMNCTHG
ncbi:hypothetical protein BDY19DRAFT_994042 [Irpex rosettiformis]|uniref:Uncharacterized protein n=1 Tax=Irpex rosettiformis TaxID=378272 RepID=A0ACB8U2T7_9APHY|nr:hypothetical protein BDY19DRAFT_994042 [Irpex rosettiformis]